MLSNIVMNMGRGRNMNMVSSWDNNRHMDMVISRNNHRNMDMISHLNNSIVSRAESSPNSRGGTSLIGPGIVGKPLRRHQVLTGTSSRVHITPLCSSTIHCLTVTLLYSSRVKEGQAGALATTVDQGGGGLGVLHGQGGGAQHQGGKDACLGEHDGFMLLHLGRHDCSGFSPDLWHL